MNIDPNFVELKAVFGKMGTEPKMRTKRYLQNHVVYQRTKMILRNPLVSPVRGARQNGHAPSCDSGWTQKAIYAGSIVIPLDAGYRGDAEDFQPERQLIRRLLYSPTGLSFYFLQLYTISPMKSALPDIPCSRYLSPRLHEMWSTHRCCACEYSRNASTNITPNQYK